MGRRCAPAIPTVHGLDGFVIQRDGPSLCQQVACSHRNAVGGTMMENAAKPQTHAATVTDASPATAHTPALIAPAVG